MALLNDEILNYVGMESAEELACDVVETGAVRRYVQAIMDGDRIYFDASAAQRLMGPVAPWIFAMDIFRRPFDTPDPVQIYANDPDFDGVGPPSGAGLPPIEPLRHFAVLYGGSEFEFYRYPRHGERVSVKQRYSSITEKQSSKGPMILVEVESEYFAGDALLTKSRMTTIWRQPA